MYQVTLRPVLTTSEQPVIKMDKADTLLKALQPFNEKGLVFDKHIVVIRNLELVDSKRQELVFSLYSGTHKLLGHAYVKQV